MNVFALSEPAAPCRLTDHLVQSSEAGKLTLVTRDGAPLFLAVPFDRAMVLRGLPAVLAARLFEKGLLSRNQSELLSGLTPADFAELLETLLIESEHPFFRHWDSDQLY